MKHGTANETTIQIIGYDESRTVLSPMHEGRRIFAFQLSAAPPEAWLVLFTAECSRKRNVTWRPMEIRNDCLFIDCVVDELPGQLAHAKGNMRNANRRYKVELETREEKEARIARSLSVQPSKACVNSGNHGVVIGSIRAWLGL